MSVWWFGLACWGGCGFLAKLLGWWFGVGYMLARCPVCGFGSSVGVCYFGFAVVLRAGILVLGFLILVFGF